MSGIVLNHSGDKEGREKKDRKPKKHRHGAELYPRCTLCVTLSLWLSSKMLTLRKFLPEMVYLTRVEHFNAAHKLFNPAWTVSENEAVFGKCANENWHGHNYELYVTIKGEPDANTGFLFDVKKLSIIVKSMCWNCWIIRTSTWMCLFCRLKCVLLKTWPLVSGTSWCVNFRRL